MTSTHFDVDDARSDRAAELREQRARARAERNGQEPEPEREPEPVKPKPVPAGAPPRSEPVVDTSRTRAAFTPVDELPEAAHSVPRGVVPEARKALIEYCRKWPGQWVRYEAIPDRDHAKPYALAAMARKAQGGFTRGFECKVRAKVPYVRFNGEES